MRLRQIIPAALLLTTAFVATSLAGENDPVLFPRVRKKAEDSRPVQLIARQTGDPQPLPAPQAGGPVVVTPPPAAPAVPAPVPAVPAPVPAVPAPAEPLLTSGSTPCINCTNPGAVVPAAHKCPSGTLAKVFPKLEQPKPALDCSGCGSFRCEARFIWGSCRAFFGEGRYQPRFPNNCPCEK